MQQRRHSLTSLVVSVIEYPTREIHPIFMIDQQPVPSYVVSTIEYPSEERRYETSGSFFNGRMSRCPCVSDQSLLS